MAGSRKGEQRGGARPGRGRVSKVSRPVSRQKAVDGEVIPPRAKHNTHVRALALDREMFEIITGKKSKDMPTELQLENMRAFQAKARQYAEQAASLIMVVPKNDKQRREIEAELALCEMREREYRILAAQVARDAAPFHHPRLAAVAHYQPQGSGDAFDALLAEIDQGPRLKVIEQRKREKDEEAA